MKTKRASNRAARPFAAGVALALALVACGSNADDTDDDAGTAAEEGATDVTGTPPADNIETVTSDAGEPATTDAAVESEIVEAVDESEEAEPVSGGTLRFAIEADVDGLNPTSSALTASGLNMANAVFDTLTAFDDDASPVPYLAESVEPVDGDLTVWRVGLRPGVTFHDGTPLDAAAVKANFDAQLADPLVGLAVRPFFPAEGAVTVLDDLNAEFRMLEPTAVFAALLASQLGMVASPTWLAAAAEDPTLNQEPVGSGPFVFDSRSEDSLTRFVRNDAWWGEEVWLDAVEFLPVPDPSTRNELIFEGDVDMAHSADPASVGDLQSEDELQSVLDENGEENFIMLNASAPPFDDVRARQALAFVTPLQNVRDLIGLGVARPADQMFIPESRYYNPDVVQDGDDPARAAELAAEYCADVPENCSDGKINMTYQFTGGAVTAAREADILDEGWSEAFNVEFNALAQDATVRNVALGNYQTVSWRQFGTLEPLGSRQNLLCRTISDGLALNFPRFCTESRDALILEALATEDVDGRVVLWQGITQEMHDAYTYIFTRHTPWLVAFEPDVRGVCGRTNPEGAPLRCVLNGRAWFDSVWISD